MTINHYFQSGSSIGTNNEHILNEDVLNKYTQAYPLEMYLTDINGFTGEGDLLTKFGVELRDQANFVVSRRRWEQTVARAGSVQLDTRPAEGDLLFFPKTKSFFEIRRVEGTDPFFQIGKLYVYNLFCELFQYSSEVVDTHRTDIDDIERIDSLDIRNFDVLLENGSRMLLEFNTPSSVILESFNITDKDSLAQNDAFDTESVGILDFSEKNPFGDYS
jgi:hypothetical protein